MRLLILFIIWGVVGLATLVNAAERSGRAKSVKGIGESDDPTRQTDADWMDDRWQRTDVGQFLGAAISTPGQTTFKAVAIKVGDRDEATVCFDTELLRYSAGWTGGFLEMHPRRYGLLVAPKPSGNVQFNLTRGPGWDNTGEFSDPRRGSLGPLPRNWGRYKGLFLHGKRVVLSYSVGDSSVLDSPWIESAREMQVFTRTIQIEGLDRHAIARVCEFERGEVERTSESGRQILLVESGDEIAAVALIGDDAQLDVIETRTAVVRCTGKRALVKLLIWRGSKADFPGFKELVRRSSAPGPLMSLTRGGPARWTESLVTRGAVGREEGPFAIDTLTLPYQNPWNALFFVGGHDFFENGDIALCTAHGDVWRVSGVDQTLRRLEWKRIATGLYQPLGLKIVNDRVHVLERGQITVLHDLNGDRETDYYENFNNDCMSAGGGHSFATCLETDRDGNFYFLKCAEDTPHGGALLRVLNDGSRLDVIATGFRNPNGLGIGPDDTLTAADQQGNWVPETRLDVVRSGGFYGYMPMHKRTSAPASFDPPLVWIPRNLDNSAGGQVWVPDNSWGPLGGQMLHLSYGRCRMMLVLRDATNPYVQGAVVSLPGRFVSGAMRGRFSPRDGHLYVCGLRGWQTAAARDGCLQRVRYTGKPLHIPVGFSVRSNGIELRFSEPLERKLAEQTDSYDVEQWNYRWSENYGSPDFSPSKPNQEGRDPVPVLAARLSSDQRTVFLEMQGLKPVMSMEIRYDLNAADGEFVQGAIDLTINELSKNSK